MNNDIENKELVQGILKDIRREDEDIISFIESHKEYDEMSELTKIELYHRLGNRRPDAERREYALKSYLKYEKLRNYKLEDDYMYYDDIKITADLLTGSKEVLLMYDKLVKDSQPSEDTKKIFNAFYQVVYTIGNCCPVRKNKGGRRGKLGGIETCFYKLNKYIKPQKIYPCVTEMPPEQHKNLQKRSADNMFAVFAEEIKGEDIIINLYFQDYYDGKNKLLYSQNNNVFTSIDEYAKYIRIIVKLIIQRGYRIINNKTDIHFKEEEKKQLYDIFKQVGLPKDNKSGYVLASGEIRHYESGRNDHFQSA